ncbi:HEAT repeat domain-containing protein [Acetobacterium bakii]|uniref:HEAT repeat domain-containing protein n=1 Tax=Acetobacterium bakii TaxID=52689 RepID=A0A0L6U3P0_9FIRM|nr:HEAT repeat domain-containing protein [Acetobacterium bakii]KNZ43136.1 hypothetical protein AKG39_03020 [Acetobacterium bakii]
MKTERIHDIKVQMQKNPMEKSVIQCYVNELLRAKNCEGIKIILNETSPKGHNPTLVTDALLESKNKAARVLCKHYHRLNDEQQKKAIQILGQLQAESAVEFLKVIFSGNDKWLAMDAVPGLQPFVDKDMIPMIFDVIADSDYYRELKIACVALLVDIGPAAVPELIRIVNEKPGVCALHAIQALGEIGDPAATPTLCECLEKSDEYEIPKIAEALGKIKDPEATLPLCNALMSKTPWKDEILVALGRIGNPLATPILITYFNQVIEVLDRNYYMESAFFLLEVMGKMNDVAMIEPLTRVFKYSPGKYRVTALKSLENLRILVGDAPFFISLYELPKSIHQNALSEWFHLEDCQAKSVCQKLLIGERYIIENVDIGNNDLENNALIACLLLPLGFEKESMSDAIMRAEAIKSIILFKEKAYDCLAPWFLNKEIANDISEILEQLEEGTR